MPATHTYPGVYVEQLPSRVRAISTVAASVTAFVGYTAKEPINQVVTITSFAGFERRFGGLDVKGMRRTGAVRTDVARARLAQCAAARLGV